jgi:hypothetical protein
LRLKLDSNKGAAEIPNCQQWAAIPPSTKLSGFLAKIFMNKDTKRAKFKPFYAKNRTQPKKPMVKWGFSIRQNCVFVDLIKIQPFFT